MQTLLGKAGFRKGMDLYFKRHDGQAVTCDDFLSAMQDANGVDLGTFSRWYEQAGTPQLTVEGSYDADAKVRPQLMRFDTLVSTAYGDEGRPARLAAHRRDGETVALRGSGAYV